MTLEKFLNKEATGMNDLSTDLTGRICDQIDQHGPIPFADFMQMALYMPQLGYYSNGTQKFGEQGDFITAPEISSLFSKCLANQCQQVLADLSGGAILEFGAGSGIMACDILQALQQKKQALPDYYILELSAELKARQHALIAKQAPELLNQVTWLDQLPDNFEGVILANEVIDAMPVHQFIIRDDVREIFVTHQNRQLIEHIDAPSSQLLADAIKQLEINFAAGYRSEINLMQTAWIKSLSQCLTQGVIILIDYGFPQHEYYHPDRSCGTVMCHYQHKSHDNPYINVGVQDITAHVDFTAIAQVAVDHELDVLGFTHQAGFLTDCGLTNLVASEDPVAQFNYAQQIKRLTLPSEMGELFKVLALGKLYENDLLGFNHFDQLNRL